MVKKTDNTDITRHRDAYYAVKALEVASYATGALGFAMVCLPQVSMPIFEWMLYKSRGIPIPYDHTLYRHNHFIYGVAGGVVAGWAVSLYYAIQSDAFRRGKPEGLKSILAPLCTWFVLDSSVSIYTGHWPNAVLNTACAAAFGIPLLVIKKYFNDSKDE